MTPERWETLKAVTWFREEQDEVTTAMEELLRERRTYSGPWVPPLPNGDEAFAPGYGPIWEQGRIDSLRYMLTHNQFEPGYRRGFSRTEALWILDRLDEYHRERLSGRKEAAAPEVEADGLLATLPRCHWGACEKLGTRWVARHVLYCDTHGSSYLQDAPWAPLVRKLGR